MSSTQLPSVDDLSKNACDTEREAPITGIFCSFSPFPKGSQESGVRFNSTARLILYLTIMLYYIGFEKWHVFLAGGLAVLTVLYVIFRKKEK